MVSVNKRLQYLWIWKGSFTSSRIPFSIQTGLFGKLHFAVFTLVLELITKEFNFTLDVLIYCIVYLHKIWVVAVLLLFTQLFTAVFTLVLELIDKELNFSADMLIYRIVYSHKIWVVTVLLLFTQLFTAVFTLVIVISKNV